MPQQEQRHAFAFEFAVNLGPIGLAALDIGDRRPGWIQSPFKRSIIKFARPAHASHAGSGERIADRALANPDAPPNLAVTFTDGSKPQDLS